MNPLPYLQKLDKNPEDWATREEFLKNYLIEVTTGPIEVPYTPEIKDVLNPEYWMYSRELWEPASWLFREYLDCTSSNSAESCFSKAMKVVLAGRAKAANTIGESRPYRNLTCKDQLADYMQLAQYAESRVFTPLNPPPANELDSLSLEALSGDLDNAWSEYAACANSNHESEASFYSTLLSKTLEKATEKIGDLKVQDVFDKFSESDPSHAETLRATLKAKGVNMKQTPYQYFMKNAKQTQYGEYYELTGEEFEVFPRLSQFILPPGFKTFPPAEYPLVAAIGGFAESLLRQYQFSNALKARVEQLEPADRQAWDRLTQQKVQGNPPLPSPATLKYAQKAFPEECAAAVDPNLMNHRAERYKSLFPGASVNSQNWKGEPSIHAVPDSAAEDLVKQTRASVDHRNPTAWANFIVDTWVTALHSA